MYVLRYNRHNIILVSGEKVYSLQCAILYGKQNSSIFLGILKNAQI